MPDNKKLFSSWMDVGRRLFRRMPEVVLRYMVETIMEDGHSIDESVCLSRYPTNTPWDAVCAPYSAFEVAFMRWREEQIEVSRSTLDDSTWGNVEYCLRETIEGGEPINSYCQSKYNEYVEYLRRNHAVPGNPFIAYKYGNRYRLLDGYLRCAAAFNTGHHSFSMNAWVGEVPSLKSQREELIQAMQAVQKKITEVEKKTAICMHPECHNIAIGSHSQQEHGQLDNLAEDGSVYALNRDHVKILAPYFFKGEELLPRLSRQKIASVSKFPGYCQAHDDNLFKCIEKEPLVKDTAKQVLAFHLRALSYMSARQRHELVQTAELWNYMSEMVGRFAPNPQMINWLIYVPADYEMLIKPCFKAFAINDLKWVWRIIDKNIGVSCSSCITPMDDKLADDLIGSATDYKNGVLKRPRPFASLSVVPKQGCTHVVVAWHKDVDALAKEFTGRLASTDTSVFQQALNEALFDKSEDYTVAPSLWESLSEEDREILEYATVAEHMRTKIEHLPQIIKLDDCNVV